MSLIILKVYVAYVTPNPSFWKQETETFNMWNDHQQVCADVCKLKAYAHPQKW